MKIAICDDDPEDIEVINNHILAHVSFHEIIKFTSPKPFLLRVYSGEHFDILFLDVHMPDSDGWEIAKQLKESNIKLFIAMVTISKEYINNCFDRVDWFAYKPITAQTVHKIIDFAYAGFYQPVVEFRNGMSDVVLTVAEIIYAEILKNDLCIHTVNRTYKLRSTLMEFEKKLARIRCFTKIHRSYILNMSFLVKIEGYCVHLKNGETLPVSRSRKKTLHDAFCCHAENSRL
jgi:DNA-binding LytR/AlgR family response regulator